LPLLLAADEREAPAAAPALLCPRPPPLPLLTRPPPLLTPPNALDPPVADVLAFAPAAEFVVVAFAPVVVVVVVVVGPLAPTIAVAAPVEVLFAVVPADGSATAPPLAG
jgi:hypothetical protein